MGVGKILETNYWITGTVTHDILLTRLQGEKINVPT